MSTASEPRNQSSHLPAPIAEKLVEIIARHRAAERVFQIAGMTALAILTLVIMISVDLHFEFDSPVARLFGWGLACSLFGLTGLLARRFTQRPLSWLDAAWRVEAVHPQLEERLSSTVELAPDPQSAQACDMDPLVQVAAGKSASQHRPSLDGYSPRLLSALQREATRATETLDPQSIPLRNNRRMIIAAATAVTLLI